MKSGVNQQFITNGNKNNNFANITLFIKMFVRNKTIGLRDTLRFYWRAGRAFSNFEKV